MRDLFYQTSIGVGCNAYNMHTKSVDDGLPKAIVEQHKNDFSVFIFGNSISPRDAKSPVFKTRNIIGAFSCAYIGRNRGLMRASYLEDACSLTDKTFSGEPIRELVVIHGFGMDITDDSIDDMFVNLFSIIKSEVKKNFEADDVVVCWFLNEEELKFVLDRNQWGSQYIVDEKSGAILMY